MKLLRILLLILAAVLGAGAFYLYAGSSVPQGQPEMVRLTPANFGALRDAFNAARDQPRLVVLMAPTCPVCLQGASALQRVLTAQSDPRLRVFVVWEPVLATDWGAPSTFTLRRISDSRAQQYWDRGRLLSKAMGEKDNSSIVWDHALVYPKGAVWQDAPPKPSFEGGTVLDVTDDLAKALDLAIRQQ
jgi:hypothetical protein